MDLPPYGAWEGATFAEIAKGVGRSTDINPDFKDALAAFKDFLASQENVTLTRDQLKILKGQGAHVLEACAKYAADGGDLSNILPIVTKIFSGVSDELGSKFQWEQIIEDPSGHEIRDLESVIGDAFERLADQLREMVKGKDAESTIYRDDLERARQRDRKKIEELSSVIRMLSRTQQNLRPREIVENSMNENLKIIGDRTIGQKRVDAKRSLMILAEMTGQSLPPSAILDKEFVKIGNYAVNQGGAYDVFLGEYFTGEKIAIKVLRHRVDRETARKTHERFARQARNWSILRHDCILPFYGIGVMPSPVSDTEFQLYLVSPYLQNRDVRRYLKTYPDVPLYARLQMVLDVARGLRYMHAESDFDERPGLVHCALNIFNILVKDSGRAVISGFGHTKVIEGPPLAFTGDNPEYRYMAPEAMDDTPLTYGADIWSWAMTSVEILTDMPPFGQAPIARVIRLIGNGKVPAREDHPSIEKYECRDKIWELLQACWNMQPESRPRAEEVMQRLIPMLQQLGKRTDPLAQGDPPPPPTQQECGRVDQRTQQAPYVPGQDHLGRSTAPVVGSDPITGDSRVAGDELGRASTMFASLDDLE